MKNREVKPALAFDSVYRQLVRSLFSGLTEASDKPLLPAQRGVESFPTTPCPLKMKGLLGPSVTDRLSPSRGLRYRCRDRRGWSTMASSQSDGRRAKYAKEEQGDHDDTNEGNLERRRAMTVSGPGIVTWWRRYDVEGLLVGIRRLLHESFSPLSDDARVRE